MADIILDGCNSVESFIYKTSIWKYSLGLNRVNNIYPIVESLDDRSLISHVGLYFNQDAIFLRNIPESEIFLEDEYGNGLFLYDKLDLITKKMKEIVALPEHDKLVEELKSISDLEKFLEEKFSGKYRR
jgi:hypothetical protein